MNSKSTLLLVMLFGLVSLAWGAKAAQLGGMDGFVERMGGGVRELGMGNAAVSDSGAMPGAFWNPAVLALRRNVVWTMHGEQRSLDRAGGALGIEGRAGARVGVGASFLFRGDTDFEVVDEEDQTLGSAMPWFMMGWFGLGARLSRRDAIGFSMGFGYTDLGVADFYDDIDMVDEHQSPMSLTVAWHRRWNQRWESSVVARNLGFNSNLSARTRLNPSRDNSLPSSEQVRPKVLALGVGYHTKLLQAPLALRMDILDYQMVDTLVVFDTQWHTWIARLGAEWLPMERAALRLGYDVGNYSMGAGYRFDLRWNRRPWPLWVDYALVYESAPGFFNPLSLGVRGRL